MTKLLPIFLFLSACITVTAGETGYATELNIPYTDEASREGDAYLREKCVLDIYHPQTTNFPTVVWFHGGGLTGGDKSFPKPLQQQGICIVAVNYRLSPRVEAADCIRDAAAATAWVFEHIADYGGNPSLVFVSGHSAGGYLTSMIGLDKRWLGEHHIDANRIAGLIPLSGHTITHFTVRKERGIERTRPIVDEMAPLYHVRADAPPLLLITGDREKEMLGRYEENAYLARMMKVVGHPHTELHELQGYGHNVTEPAFPLLVSEVRRISDAKQKEPK